MTRIYVQLLDEGTTTYRPTEGIPLGDDIFVVVATPDYESSEELWEFPPGSTVVCDRETKSGKEILIARRPHEGDGAGGA